MSTTTMQVEGKKKFEPGPIHIFIVLSDDEGLIGNLDDLDDEFGDEWVSFPKSTHSRY